MSPPEYPTPLSHVHTRTSFMHRRTAPGEVPGTLVTDPNSPDPVFQILKYSIDTLYENKNVRLDAILSAPEYQPDDHSVTWINIEGLGNASAVEALGKAYHLHPLALEDVVNAHQRPKLEPYENVIYVVARMPHPEMLNDTEQVSFFLGKNFLITFQEGTPGDVFEPVRERIRESKGRIRQPNAAYLMYALLDTAIDQYFPQLEYYVDLLESIEDRILKFPYAEVASELHTIRRHLLFLHRSIRPLQDMLNAIMREERFVDEATRVYLRDCLDHTAQLMDMLDTYRDVATQLMDMSVSAAGHRMNEIMKFLTVMSSIFIPLTFIAGVYGMNFDHSVSPYNMPELHWVYGYPFCLFLMAISVIALIAFFRYRGWLGIPESDRHHRKTRRSQR